MHSVPFQQMLLKWYLSLETPDNAGQRTVQKQCHRKRRTLPIILKDDALLGQDIQDKNASRGNFDRDVKHKTSVSESLQIGRSLSEGQPSKDKAELKRIKI
ncbi:hypothetical protein CEXT_409061 [Caerostris extrusa]|uniref:Uncharacterized protein n=1 Tax=Caerostris extrusa TaxID=172846 RepID=A0AAV4XZ64_CAEEX|nr:hypothetical protein CEXT_409061 [Caerostris extrusa]